MKVFAKLAVVEENSQFSLFCKFLKIQSLRFEFQYTWDCSYRDKYFKD